VKKDKRDRGLEVQAALTSSHFNLSTSPSSSSPSSSKAFTLIEVLIVLVIISSVLAFSVIGTQKFRNSLEYSSSVNQILSDIKLTQQLAVSSAMKCRIDFNFGKNTYTILKENTIYRAARVNDKIRLSGKSYFAFDRFGQTSVGESGTLSIGGAPVARKIIVSQRGRIRVE
jgi:prepilin-type N-terminal cleavage/methylation domain-containing protein